jgi:putative SOS response-associated peptidase YedK
MCSHYQTVKDAERHQRYFGCPLPETIRQQLPKDVWPGYPSNIVVRHIDATDTGLTTRQSRLARFGLIPHWASDPDISRHTFNARAETVSTKPSFRYAWQHAQRCIVPAEAFYEPDWRTGHSVATRIARRDGAPMGLAGLWATWRAPQGEWVQSFTLLTINADEHPLMRRFHRPGVEKRMVVVLPDEDYETWLRAPNHAAAALLQPYPADRLDASPAEPAKR